MEARVLLVEDDPELAEFVRFLFEQEKYEVVVATDGEEGLKKAREVHPDVVLLDVLLPKIHGYEVCDRLRQDPATCLIPIVMVTSLTATKDRVTGLKLGADEYIPKPFEPVELLARVERLIQRSKQNIAANPLTGLAGAATLHQDLQHRLEKREAFTLGFCDINQLAAFNDAYGFSRGDDVIRLVGTILRSAITELGNATDVVTHMGGDDFAFITTHSRGEVIGARVLENMDALAPLHYAPPEPGKDDAPVREIPASDSNGNLLTLSLGLVDALPNLYQHPAQILDRARQALAVAKETGGNQVAKLS
jgi:diguanylate cyclase (GGDEF)-like protein